MYLTDQMVLVGLGLGVVYWLIETFLYVIQSYHANFVDYLFGPDLGGLCTRIIVLCLFLIFGSHAQYTMNRRRRTESKLIELKDMNLKLEREISKLKTS
ncbi:MAG: hypothetical protein JRI75_06120 [Deltaproteobacteria bacterium]|nr:hypothetical protein [Deltaproteobacteria bacterium]